MELQLPLSAISGGVDADVLTALARGPRLQMDAAMLARMTGKSYTGVRHALDRLVRHGTVVATTVGARTLFHFNDRHILAAAILEIVAAKARLFDRLTELLESGFTSPPVFAAVFGSASRDEMTPESDIDLFLVRPDEASPDTFEEEGASLAQSISELTGNDARVLIYELSELTPGTTAHPVLGEIAREGIPLRGSLAEFRRTVLGRRTSRATR